MVAPRKVPAKKAPAKKAAASRTPPKPRITAEHQADINRIFQRMQEMAEDHGYCDDFWDAVDSLADGMVAKFPEGSKTETVRLSFGVDVVLDNFPLKVRGTRNSYGDLLKDEQRDELAKHLSRAIDEALVKYHDNLFIRTHSNVEDVEAYRH